MEQGDIGDANVKFNSKWRSTSRILETNNYVYNWIYSHIGLNDIGD
jgi:hypothetical protein